MQGPTISTDISHSSSPTFIGTYPFSQISEQSMHTDECRINIKAVITKE